VENENLFYEIRAMAAEIAEVSEESIKPESVFDDDLGIDSVKALELMVAIERKYEITFDEERLSEIIREIKTVNDAVLLTARLIQEKSHS
jgi:acyl carrier protein